jgi:hypothetical protein
VGGLWREKDKDNCSNKRAGISTPTIKRTKSNRNTSNKTIGASMQELTREKTRKIKARIKARVKMIKNTIRWIAWEHHQTKEENTGSRSMMN